LLHSQVGQVETASGQDRIVVKAGDTGCVLYGPYVRLRAGQYFVEFRIRSGVARVNNDICCRIDVATDFGKRVVSEKSVHCAELVKSDGLIPLHFKVDAEGQFEFRVFSTGIADLTIDMDRPLKMLNIENEHLSPVIFSGVAASNPLYANNFPTFKFFQDNGFAMEVSSDTIKAHFNGLIFYVENTEDCQVLYEVYLHNEYNLMSGRDKMVIDIGMNVGLTSLYMANNATVREVHSFEPFSVPFNRALRNFALNPALAAKIRPNRFGLNSKNDRIEVLVSEDHTISTSIRGINSGQPEVIYVKDAAEIIRPLAERAKAEDLDLIVKVDCEGSEFGIFESLEREQLFGSINAMVVEWHKWWSAEKTQMNLINPLLQSGFIVFDRTESADPHAGLFYAVRAARQ
jgi:FkbM family methyltransferase